MTLKQCQGYEECNELVISTCSTIMQSSTFITIMVSEQIPMLKFSTSQDTWPTKNMLIIPLNTQQSHINRILRNPFHVCSNHTTFELQRTRIRSTPFAGYISDTPVTMKQSQSHQIYNDNVDLKIIIVHSLKDLVLKVYGEKSTKFQLKQIRA